MRNSEARKYARWSAVVALTLFLVVLVVYLRRSWAARQAAKAAPPAVPEAIEQRSAEFSFSKVTGQQKVFTVRASRQTEFKQDGRNLLEDVSIEIFGPRGERHDTMRTQACDLLSSAGKITCAGDVLIDLRAASDATPANAIHVMTSHITFDRGSGEVLTTMPVTFHWPGGEGRGTGAQYNSSDGTLRLDRDVAMQIQPRDKQDAGLSGQPLSVSSAVMIFERDHRLVQMLGGVHAQQDAREMSADSVRLELDPTLRARQLTASGRPMLRDTTGGMDMEISADELTAALTPEGAVTTVVGRGNVQGARTGLGAQDNMQAARVQVDFGTPRNAPRLLTASGGVILKSLAGGERTVRTDALEIHFLNSSNAPGALQSVNTLAPATVEWRSDATGAQPAQMLRMRGQKMNMSFVGQNQLEQLTGSGGVEVTRQLNGAEQTSTSRDLAAQFEDGQWVQVDQTGEVRFRDGMRNAQGDRARLDRGTDSVTLTGAVVVNDATTRTTAQSAVFNQDTNEFRADGRVVTTSVSQSAATASPSTTAEAMHVTAEHLVGNSSKGHAIYTGSCRFWQGSSLVEADRMDLDNLLQTVVAEGHVQGVFPQAVSVASEKPSAASATDPSHSRPQGELWHVTGGRLTYWSTESKARLEQKATADSQDNSIHADQIDLHFSPQAAANTANTLEGRQLTSAQANGSVQVRQGERRGRSEAAAYTAAENKFVLSGGQPSVYDASGDTVSGRELTFYFADDRIVVDSEEGSRTVTLHRVEK